MNLRDGSLSYGGDAHNNEKWRCRELSMGACLAWRLHPPPRCRAISHFININAIIINLILVLKRNFSSCVCYICGKPMREPYHEQRKQHRCCCVGGLCDWHSARARYRGGVLCFFLFARFLLCVFCAFFFCGLSVVSNRLEGRIEVSISFFLVCNFSFCVGVCVSASFLLALYRLWRADGG